MDSEASALDGLRQALERSAASMKQVFNARLDALYTTVLASPGTILALFIIISAVFAQQGMAFQDQIDDDVEIFFPTVPHPPTFCWRFEPNGPPTLP